MPPAICQMNSFDLIHLTAAAIGIKATRLNVQIFRDSTWSTEIGMQL